MNTGDLFGVYVTPSARSTRTTTSTELPIFQAAMAGAGGGLLTALLGGVPYWLTYHDDSDVTLAWGEVSVVFIVFIVATGGLVCMALRAGVSAFDRFLYKGPVRSALSCVLGASTAAVIAGVLPGSFGTAYFGSQHAPFMGTAMLALAPLPGALLASSAIAFADRRAAGVDVSFAKAFGLATASTLAFAAVGTILCAAVDDDSMLHAFLEGSAALSVQANSPQGLARVGAVAGAVLGFSVGSQLGVTMGLARLVFRKPKP